MIPRTDADRQIFHLETLLHAVNHYRDTLKEHLSQQEGLPAAIKAPVELRQLWSLRVDHCTQHARELTDQIAEIRIEHAYHRTNGHEQSPAPAADGNDAPATKPRKRRRRPAAYDGT